MEFSTPIILYWSQDNLEEATINVKHQSTLDTVFDSYGVSCLDELIDQYLRPKKGSNRIVLGQITKRDRPTVEPAIDRLARVEGFDYQIAKQVVCEFGDIPTFCQGIRADPQLQQYSGREWRANVGPIGSLRTRLVESGVWKDPPRVVLEQEN